MDKKVQRMEELIERSIDNVTSHPAFLIAVSSIINANSYRKIWLRKSVEAVWKDLELPVRREHEKLVSQVEELTVRVKKLELQLESKDGSKVSPPPPRANRSVNRSGQLKSKEMELQ